MSAGTNIEREVKLANGKLSLDDLAGEPLEPRHFTSTYYDTHDHLLARVGITLRRRVENGLGLWQLKLPRSRGRLEVEQPGGPVAPPEQIESLLAGVLRGRALSPVTELRTLRRGVRVHSGASIADVILDQVAVMRDLLVESRFDEVEIELVEGEARALGEFEELVRRAGAKDGDPRPKVLRVLALDEPRPTRERPQLQAYFQKQYEEILAHDPGTRLGDDPEDLHDIRVAVRRLRAILKVAAPPLDPVWAQDLRDELDRLGDVLAPVRDLDVMLDYVRKALGEDERKALQPLLKKLERQRSTARRSMLATMQSAWYARLVDALETAARRPPTRSGRPQVDRLAARQFKQLRKAVRRLDRNPSDAALHNARIKGKQARYATELARPGAGNAAAFLRQAKSFQDITGEHQDAVVTEERIRELAGGLEPETALAAGRLIERQRIRKGEAREAFPKTWKKLDKAGKRAWA
jgi:CHAD domain-containing protein